MTPEEFRHHGHALIDFIADTRTRIAAGEFPVMALVKPGALRAQLPKSAPLQGEPFENVLADLEKLILPACTHFLDPRFYGFFPGANLLPGVLGDLASTGLGQLGLSWQSSPALTELEEVTTDWLRQASGLSDAWQGVLQDTASSATLVALICARERATAYSAARGGLQSHNARLVMYASKQAHSSVEKAATLAGFGRDTIRLIDTDDKFALRADHLAAAIRADQAAGLQPCAIVATTGTTGTTALDPVAACAALAREHGLWLHVDAAMAGSAMLLPECRWMWEGVEGADSIVTNPHKWLGVSFDCSAYFVRDPEHLIRVMSTNPSYLQTAADGQVRNYRDWGIPLGRRMRALKLWFVLREQGIEAIQTRLQRDIANAKWLAEQVDAAASTHWRRLAPVPLQTVCLRHEPPGLSGDALDTHTLAWARRLNESGQMYVTPSLLAGRWMVRVSIGSSATERHHVEAAWQQMQREVKN